MLVYKYLSQGLKGPYIEIQIGWKMYNWLNVSWSFQQCFIWRPSDSTMSEDAGFEARIVATLGNQTFDPPSKILSDYTLVSKWAVSLGIIVTGMLTREFFYKLFNCKLSLWMLIIHFFPIVRNTRCLRSTYSIRWHRIFILYWNMHWVYLSRFLILKSVFKEVNSKLSVLY